MGRRALTRAAVATAALATGCGEPPAPPEVVPVLVRPAGGLAERASGVALGGRRVLTVAHPLAGARSVRVWDTPARVLREDRALDLAVLAAATSSGGRPAAEGGALDDDAGSDEVRAGDAVRVLVRRGGGIRALPAAVRRRVSARLVDQPGRPRRPTLELAVDVRPGDSGAPVLDAGGRLVAIVYARSTRRPVTTYAVHGPALRAFITGG